VRALEELNPIPGGAGQRFVFNGNMIPIELAGQQYTKDAAPTEAAGDEPTQEAAEPEADEAPRRETKKSGGKRK